MTFKRILGVGILAGALTFYAGAALAVDTDPVVAVVNGKNVYLTDVENARNLLPQELQGAPLRDIYPMLMESLISSRLSADKAQELGYHETPEYLHRMARVSDQILQRMLLQRHIEQKLTDALIMERYQLVAEKAKGQFEINARHILVESEDEAKKLIVELEDGADFAELAKAHSIGPSKEQGGELGWFGPGQMIEAFYQAALQIEADQFSKMPVQTKFGWHIIFVEERRPFPVPSYQDAREILANDLSAELGRAYMSQLRDAAKIEKKSFEEVVKALQE